MGEHNINAVFNSAKELIEKRAKEGNPDKLIHCICYCFKSDILRFENIEKETISLLMNQYDDNNLPVILVITQNYDNGATKIMTDFIKNEFKFLNRELTIVPVVAKEKILKNEDNKIVFKKKGIEELLKVCLEKSKKAIYPAFKNSIKQKIIQAFEINTENKKNKLIDYLNESVTKLLNEIPGNNNIEAEENNNIGAEENNNIGAEENNNIGAEENNNIGAEDDDEFQDNISKLSLIFERTLNIFFEIPLISEKSKEDITEFLHNLCQWCIETLNNIISELIKENSNKLSLLLYKEQTRVKKNHNVESALNNEKSIDDFRIESENDLKPSITKEVYILAIKNIYNIILTYLIELSEEVINEQFNKIKPELKNYISAEKLKQISDKILQNIILNK